jgi:DNA-directed RNA polymerase I, II, and III subunit RPABC2
VEPVEEEFTADVELLNATDGTPAAALHNQSGNRKRVKGEQRGLQILQSGAPQIDAEREAERRKERITTPYMTKYEKARILGTRALQIR